MTTNRDRPRSDTCGPLPISALAAIVVLAIGCRAAEIPQCPAGAQLEVDLSAWSLTVERMEPVADGLPAYDSVLAQLDLEPLPTRAREEPASQEPEDHAVALVSIEITDLRRGNGEPPDLLVAARFRGLAGAESLRAQVLRPIAGQEHLYCALGKELSHDKGVFEEPCMEQAEGPARSLALESLVAPDRDAILVEDSGGWCGPGSRRGDRLATSYWGVEQGRLTRYFEATTFESWYESPAPPAKTHRGEIELSGAWPKVITLAEVVECDSDLPASADDCVPFERTREYRYRDHRYLADTPAQAPASSGVDSGKETVP